MILFKNDLQLLGGYCEYVMEASSEAHNFCVLVARMVDTPPQAVGFGH